MNNRTAVYAAWTACFLALALGSFASILLVASWSVPTRRGFASQESQLALTIAFMAFAVMGAIIATRHPKHPVGWLFIAVGLVNSTQELAFAYAFHSLLARAMSTELEREAAWLSTWLWVPGLFGASTLVLLLFPDGHLPSPRWRPVAWLGAAGMLVLSLGLALRPGPSFLLAQIPNPFGVRAVGRRLESVGWALAASGTAAAGAALIFRLRHSAGEQQLQLKWMAFAAVAAVLTGVPAAVTVDSDTKAEYVLAFVVPAAYLWAAISVAVAIFKYRLYEIDRIINRTVVYGTLVAFIGAAYIVIAVGIGSMVRDTDEARLGLSLGTTALIAFAFQPAKERIQRLANRLVYGQRATPYESIVGFSRRMSGTLSVEDVIPRMAEAAARGVGAARSRVRLFLPGDAERSQTWPDDVNAGPYDRTIAIGHQGMIVGEVAVAKAVGDPLTPAEDRLLSDLAAQAGLALHNVRLTLELRARLDEISRQAAELAASRTRIVQAQAAERRRIERNIHDGIQQQIVALRAKLGLARIHLRRDPRSADSTLVELQEETGHALEDLRELTRGIHPSVLSDRGLLEARVATTGWPVLLFSGQPLVVTFP